MVQRGRSLGHVDGMCLGTEPERLRLGNKSPAGFLLGCPEGFTITEITFDK
jgi:hypothetical protein